MQIIPLFSMEDATSGEQSDTSQRRGAALGSEGSNLAFLETIDHDGAAIHTSN